MTKEYLKAVAQLERAKAKLEEERIKMQLDCKHESVVEIPHTSSSVYAYTSPPYKICVDCGFAEKGWDCGYQILVKEPNALKANVIGKIWSNRTFVVSYPWRKTGQAPRDAQEAYEMAVKNTLTEEYLKEKG